MQSFLPFISALFYLFNISRVSGQLDKTKCVSSAVDWFTNFTGETPCRTYERVRQICNSNFRVGTMNSNATDGQSADVCNDEVADCCCNSVAFTLSTLCMTCQYGNGPDGDGRNAVPGAYQSYLTNRGENDFCSPITNRSFTPQVQAAVCDAKIKIPDYLYPFFWSDGSCVFSRQTFTKDANAFGPKDSYTKCNFTDADLAAGSASSTSSGSDGIPSQTGTAAASSATPQSSSQNLSGGAIAGIVIGIVVFLFLSATILWMLRRQQRIIRTLSKGSGVPLEYHDDMGRPSIAVSDGIGAGHIPTPYVLPPSAGTRPPSDQKLTMEEYNRTGHLRTPGASLSNLSSSTGMGSSTLRLTEGVKSSMPKGSHSSS
ncbi:hypothetical protein HGRIS_003879 [Hohenbuehelia grisea]|uniref:Uncharacterized protein n=1 Tax=Hohenbuehelia grisea TaxID=104357 RepID=A0ABR3JGV6_9AGAR